MAKNFIFLSSADYILFRFEFLLSFDVWKEKSLNIFYCPPSCTNSLPGIVFLLSYGIEFSLGQARKGKIYLNVFLAAEIICCNSFVEDEKVEIHPVTSKKHETTSETTNFCFKTIFGRIFPAVILPFLFITILELNMILEGVVKDIEIMNVRKVCKWRIPSK